MKEAYAKILERIRSMGGTIDESDLYPLLGEYGLTDDDAQDLIAYLDKEGVTLKEEADLDEAAKSGKQRQPLLTKEQEIALAKRVKEGDQAAEMELFERNLPLSISIARRYINPNDPNAEDIEEAAKLGLLAAVRKYDPSKGTRFSTCAYLWIRSYIQSAMNDAVGHIKLPQELAEYRRKINAKANELTLELCREPTPEEIADALPEISRNVVYQLLSIDNKVGSLDAPVNDGSDSTLMDFIQDSGTAGPKESAISQEDSDEMDELLERLKKYSDALTDREKVALFSAYGVFGYPKKSGEALAKEWGISRQRVNQIRQQGLRKIRQAALKDDDKAV
jgi:RNA polymerase primary sigma factor